jgi:hypothetical protein
MSSTGRLANRVAEFRKLVEARLAATRPRPCLQIIFDEGTSDAEIERLQAEAAAEAGVDPANVKWIHYRVPTTARRLATTFAREVPCVRELKAVNG